MMGTPIPRRENEIRATRSSTCTKRQMTEEEKIKYAALPAAPVPTTRKTITKEFVLAEFAKGKTVMQIEKEQNLAKSTLYGKLKEWGIRSPRSPWYSKSKHR